MKRKLLLTCSFLVSVVVTTLAQGVTTATISGKITNAKGEELPSANIVAIHVPSGTKYGTSARSDGGYTIPNARIGGPYKLTASFVGYADEVRENIFLSLGTTTSQNFVLAEEGVDLSEVVVQANSLVNSDRTGAITNISTNQIQSLPTLSRSFSDYTRLTPQASGNSFAGRSSAFNNITVDGGLFNNAFGLASTVGGQTDAQPISIDAIDQITTSIAPYDVREGSFTGAGVNVVTRSGTNDVNGSVYYFIRNESMVNSKIRNVESKFQNFAVQNMGFRLGGPIIKDKLFFFVNYEREKRTDPGTTYLASRPGLSGSNISAVKAADLDGLRTFLQDKYGFDAGLYEDYNLQTNSDKAAVKIDYNISNVHKLTLKYNYLVSYKDIPPSGSGGISNTRQPGNTGLPFLGSYYRINNNLNSFTAELNSNFGNMFSNKFQIGYSEFRDFRESPTIKNPFPMVDIGNGSGGFLTSFGFEPFSANNITNSNVFQLSDNVDIYLNKHTLSVGTYNEFYTFQNGFAPNYYGIYRFNSLNDFYESAKGTAGKASFYRLQYSTAADGAFPLVEMKAMQFGLYVQDKYQINSNFSTTFGLRADIPIISADIAGNTAVSGFNFRDGAKIETSKIPTTQVLLSPRIGFNWDVDGKGKTQVRGGSGIFTGRIPYVWISNQASNNGVLFGAKDYTQAQLNTLVFNPSVDAYRPGANGNPPASANATYPIAVTDTDFKFPQVWRTNLAVDHLFEGNWLASLDVAFTQDLNAVYHQNINLPNAPRNAVAAGTGNDTRPIFYPETNPKTETGSSNSTANTRLNAPVTDAILMSNTNQGYSYFITAQVKKTFNFGLDAMVAYTYTDAKSVNDGGSIAQSIWRNRAVSGDPNANVLGYSSFLKPHRIITSLNYRKEYGSHFATTIGAFYELAPSGKFSYVYANDMNGDNAGGNNDLIYVPRDQGEIILQDINQKDDKGNTLFIYKANDQWNDLNAYIEQDEYLRNRRGQYAERNGATRPWFAQLDLRVLQDFFLDVKGKRNTLQLSVDIFNFGNLLNSEWSVFQTPNRENLLTFVKYNKEGKPEFQYPYLNNTTKEALAQTYRDDVQNLASRWQIQVGIRYIFGH